MKGTCLTHNLSDSDGSARSAVTSLAGVPVYDDKQDIQHVSGVVFNRTLTLALHLVKQVVPAQLIHERSPSSLPVRPTVPSAKTRRPTKQCLKPVVQICHPKPLPHDNTLFRAAARRRQHHAPEPSDRSPSREPSPRNQHSNSSHRSGSFVQLPSFHQPQQPQKQHQQQAPLHWDVYGESVVTDVVVSPPLPPVVQQHPQAEPDVEHEDLHLVPLSNQMDRSRSTSLAADHTTNNGWMGLNQSLPWYDRSRGNRSMTPTSSLSTSLEQHRQTTFTSGLVSSNAWSTTRLASTQTHNPQQQSLVIPRGFSNITMSMPCR